MKKSNPLFVDTTKFNGDALFTQIELNEIPVYVGEEVTLKVTDKAGVEQAVTLERKVDYQCVGQVFLTYRQEVTYHFEVSRNGQVLYESEPKKIEASYLIQDVWKPLPLKESNEPLNQSLEIEAQDASEIYDESL